MTAKEILRRYSQNLKRVAMLEYDLKSIDNRVPIKVTDCSQDQGGSGGRGLEDMYWDRIEKKKLIEMELEVIKPEIARVEKALELIRTTHELECDAMLLRHIRNKGNTAIEIALGISVNTVTKKIKYAESELEMLYKEVV